MICIDKQFSTDDSVNAWCIESDEMHSGARTECTYSGLKMRIVDAARVSRCRRRRCGFSVRPSSTSAAIAVGSTPGVPDAQREGGLRAWARPKTASRRRASVSACVRWLQGAPATKTPPIARHVIGGDPRAVRASAAYLLIASSLWFLSFFFSPTSSLRSTTRPRSSQVAYQLIATQLVYPNPIIVTRMMTIMSSWRDARLFSMINVKVLSETWTIVKGDSVM